MWELVNHTPYAAGRTWIRDKHGVHHWIVVVKATYTLAPDAAPRLADEQAPPLRAAAYFGEPGRSSLRYEAELGEYKTTTDVILNASAHIPGGRRADVVTVEAHVGPLHKRLRVHGPRTFRSTLTGVAPGPAELFDVQPIRYELAEGGSDPEHNLCDAENPVGRGCAGDRSSLVGTSAPSVEHADASGRGPAGFGAISAHWTPRRERAGTFGDVWARNKRPLLPDDYDPRFAQSAPLDQQTPVHLEGGELVELVNLTSHGTLRFALPRLTLCFRTLLDGSEEEHAGALSTVLIEPDELRLCMLWQTTLPVPAQSTEYLDHTVIEAG